MLKVVFSLSVAFLSVDSEVVLQMVKGMGLLSASQSWSISLAFSGRAGFEAIGRTCGGVSRTTERLLLVLVAPCF